MSDEGDKPPPRKRAKREKKEWEMPRKLLPKYAEGETNLEDFAEKLAMLPRNSIRQNPFVTVDNAYNIKAKKSVRQVVGLTEEGRRLLFVKQREGCHPNSLAFYLGIDVKTLKDLAKKDEDIAWILDSAFGLHHDDHYKMLAQASLEGNPKLMLNSTAILNNKFGYKQGEERVLGEKRSGDQQFNIQIVMPASIPRDEYNKMMDDPEASKKFLEARATVVEEEGDDDGSAD